MRKVGLLLFAQPFSTAAFSPRPLASLTRPASIRNHRTEASRIPHRPHLQHCHHHHISRRSFVLRASTSEELGAEGSMKILGVCGGIGSGKSTACELMVDKLGCAGRIDADKLAHVVYEPGSKALQEIVSEFGQDIVDESSNGLIDRKKLGAIVFSDAKAMSKLEHIVWPHVRDKIEERIEDIKSHPPDTVSHNIVIVEAALLMETDWHDLLDGLWVVQSSQPVAVQRLKEHRGLSEEEALVRIHAQETRRGIGGSTDGGISDELRAEMERGTVTRVITNDGSLEDLQRTLEGALADPASFKSASHL
ncbi:hypothetical protein ACHAXT_011438 [Thalassiosira profunda]